MKDLARETLIKLELLAKLLICFAVIVWLIPAIVQTLRAAQPETLSQETAATEIQCDSAVLQVAGGEKLEIPCETADQRPD